MASQYNKIATTVNSVTSNYSFTPDLTNLIVLDTSNNRIGINKVDPLYSIDISDAFYNSAMGIRTPRVIVTNPNGLIIEGGGTAIQTASGQFDELTVTKSAIFKSNQLNKRCQVLINDKLTAGAIDISNDLLVLGDASINNILEVSNILLIKGDASINNMLEVSNNLLVLGDASINNILEVSNNLYVLGDASINNILEVSNNLIIHKELHGPNTFIIEPKEISSDYGTVEISGNLNVLNTTTTTEITSNTMSVIHILDVSNTFHVKGDASINNMLEVSNNLLVLGDASINNILEVSNNFFVKGDASINNILEVSNNLLVKGDASFNNILDVSNHLLVKGDASINNILEVSNHLLIKGDASINNMLEVSNNLLVKGDASINNILDVSNHLLVKGDASFNKNLEVTGIIKANSNIILDHHLPNIKFIRPMFLGYSDAVSAAGYSATVSHVEADFKVNLLDFLENIYNMYETYNYAHKDITILNNALINVYGAYRQTHAKDNINSILNIISNYMGITRTASSSNFLITEDIDISCSNNIRLNSNDISLNGTVTANNLLVKGDALVIDSINIADRVKILFQTKTENSRYDEIIFKFFTKTDGGVAEGHYNRMQPEALKLKVYNTNIAYTTLSTKDYTWLIHQDNNIGLTLQCDSLNADNLTATGTATANTLNVSGTATANTLNVSGTVTANTLKVTNTLILSNQWRNQNNIFGFSGYNLSGNTEHKLKSITISQTNSNWNVGQVIIYFAISQNEWGHPSVTGKAFQIINWAGYNSNVHGFDKNFVKVDLRGNAGMSNVNFKIKRISGTQWDIVYKYSGSNKSHLSAEIHMQLSFANIS